MRKKNLAILAPVLAIAVLSMVPAIAQAETLQIGGNPAINGSTIQIFSKDLKFTTENLSYQCTRNLLALKMLSNLQGVVTGGSFLNEEEKQPCETNNPEVGVDYSTNAASFWYLNLNEEQKGYISGPAGVEFIFEIQLDGKVIETCKYSFTHLSFTYNDDEEPLMLAVEAEFGVVGTPTDICVATGVFEGTFAVTSAGGAVTVDP